MNNNDGTLVNNVPTGALSGSKGNKMKKYITLAMLIVSLAVALPAVVKASTYSAASGITAIAAGPGGELYIRFEGAPNPGPCGQNFGWVVIPSTAEATKSLAQSLYFNRSAVRVVTSGCSGAYESVAYLYSPEG